MDNDGYISIELNIHGIRCIHKALSVACEKWPGGDIEEQARLSYLKNFLYRIILEWKYEMDE